MKKKIYISAALITCGIASLISFVAWNDGYEANDDPAIKVNFFYTCYRGLNNEISLYLYSSTSDEMELICNWTLRQVRVAKNGNWYFCKVKDTGSTDWSGTMRVYKTKMTPDLVQNTYVCEGKGNVTKFMVNPPVDFNCVSPDGRTWSRPVSDSEPALDCP